MSTQPQKALSLFDSVCLIVGIIIGVGIYQTAPDVAKGAMNIWGVFLLWMAGGVLSLFGALGYAELASAYPAVGGDYVYLNRAYGRWAGFLFGWVQLVIVRPGDIAVMAFAFATYAQRLYLLPGEPHLAQIIYASGVIILFTLLNCVGVREGKATQNILTIAKATGLLAILAIALAAPRPEQPVDVSSESFPLSVALILVLFSFGGWNEMAYVAAEVKNPSRNIIRALVLGTVSVTGLYLLVNGAFLYALGYAGMKDSQAVATDTVATVFPATGARFISALICVSALSALNGLIFTGARITYAIGVDHRPFRYLGHWDPQTGTPRRALMVQGIIALLLVLILGSFTATLLYTAAAVYTFYLATSVAVIVLRVKEPHILRPYKVTAFPLPTLLFCGACAFLIYSAAVYKPALSMITFTIMLLGLPLYRLTSRRVD